MWQLLIENASTNPSDTQIFRHTVSDGAVAEVNTVTLTGTAGTATVTVGGTAYLATFDTNIADTSAAFVALHAAALAVRDITLTGTTTLIFTSAIPGQPIPDPVIANVTGNLADQELRW